MARDTTSIVKLSRREGYALHPKAHKYLARRTALPGAKASGSHRRNQASQFSLQLREKQKVKRLYGLLEKQFSNLMVEASRRQGEAGAVLLQFLEQRMDNAVYRAGFSTSRRGARQLVSHGHFMLNGRVDIPSIRLKVGDELVLRDASKKNEYFTRIDEVSPASPDTVPAWLTVDRKKFQVKVTGLPTRENAEPDIHEQLIVEYYSR